MWSKMVALVTHLMSLKSSGQENALKLSLQTAWTNPEFIRYYKYIVYISIVVNIIVNYFTGNPPFLVIGWEHLHHNICNGFLPTANDRECLFFESNQSILARHNLCTERSVLAIYPAEHTIAYLLDSIGAMVCLIVNSSAELCTHRPIWIPSRFMPCRGFSRPTQCMETHLIDS